MSARINQMKTGARLSSSGVTRNSSCAMPSMKMKAPAKTPKAQAMLACWSCKRRVAKLEGSLGASFSMDFSIPSTPDATFTKSVPTSPAQGLSPANGSGMGLKMQPEPSSYVRLADCISRQEPLYQNANGLNRSHMSATANTVDRLVETIVE